MLVRKMPDVMARVRQTNRMAHCVVRHLNAHRAIAWITSVATMNAMIFVELAVKMQKGKEKMEFVDWSKLARTRLKNAPAHVMTKASVRLYLQANIAVIQPSASREFVSITSVAIRVLVRPLILVIS